MDTPAPGWHADPTGRHEHRYWDGSRWTDHVADAGTQATDPLHGGAAPGAAQTDGTPTAQTVPTGDDPTAVTDPTLPPTAAQSTQDQPGQPTQAYAAHGESTQEYPTQPGAAPPGWQGAPPPPAASAGRRPSPALIVALAVLVVALVGGIAFVLTRDDDDTTEVADRDPTSTDETVDPNQPSDGGAVDDGTGGSGSGGPVPPGGFGGDVGSESELIDLMAQSIAQGSGGELTHEQAVCISEAMIDQLGFEKLVEMGQSGAASPFEGLTPAEQGEIVGSIVECAPDAMTGAVDEQP